MDKGAWCCRCEIKKKEGRNQKKRREEPGRKEANGERDKKEEVAQQSHQSTKMQPCPVWSWISKLHELKELFLKIKVV